MLPKRSVSLNCYWLKAMPLILAGALAASSTLTPASALASKASNAVAAASACPPPVPPPSQFVDKIDNPWFPLRPGTRFTYRGTKDGDPQRDIVDVTHTIKRIGGYQTVQVHDRVYIDNVLEEDTLDWYAQDADGNVWYFGEDSKELDDQGNVVSTEGSWLAFEDGAKPGIIMEAEPKAGDKYCQESAPDVAEDMAQVMSLHASARVKFGSFDRNLLKTKEFTPLEPGAVEFKYYARNIGNVLVDAKDGNEHLELVSVRRNAADEADKESNDNGAD